MAAALGTGVRTRISDDRVWLAYAASLYLEATADIGILDEVLPFIEGPPLQEGEQDTFFQPMLSEQSASLFEHCARGLDQCLTLTGKLGLPLIGSGDWNDGMNRVGAGGTGESVWLGWLLLETLARFDGYARSRDPERARHWREHAGRLRLAMEREAWDGHWYRRATFDDGTWLGSKDGEACRIDSIAQSWAVLAGADPLRAGMAMTALERYLLRPVDRLALLFTPLSTRGARIPAISAATHWACGRMAGNTATRPCGRSWHLSARAKGTRRGHCFPCSIQSTTRSHRNRWNAIEWNPMWWPPISTPRRRMSAVVAGPGIPALPPGCTAPDSKVYWEFAGRVPGC